MPKRENSLDKIEQEEYKSINEYAYMLYKGEGIEKDVKEVLAPGRNRHSEAERKSQSEAI